MICVVPMAGPDLIHPEHGFRPLFPVEGRPLIEVALEGRPWRRAGVVKDEDYVFILRDVPEVARLAAFLGERWPGSRVVMVSALTGGALLSALAGVALADPARPLMIDLADILFACDHDFSAPWPVGLGAVVPCFTSDESCYSYLREENGRIVEAAEKRVISDKASAGVYVFRDPAVFLAAAAHSLAHRESLTYKGILFVCPAMNGVLAQGLEVAAHPATDVQPIGKLFHAPLGVLST